MKVELLDIGNTQDIERFYACGQSIRANHDIELAKFWKGSRNLHRITANENLISTFLITEDDGDQGRLGAYYEKGQDTGFLGWYECIDDPEVAKELIRAGIDWLKDKGCTKVVGPIDGSTWYGYRFNLTHDKPLIVSEPFQPRCYVNQWIASGFEEAETYTTTYSAFPDIPLLSEEEVGEKLAGVGLKLQSLTRDLLKAIDARLYDFLIITFPGNPYFSHVEKEEYDEFSAGFPAVLDERYSFIAVDQEENPIAFVTCLIDSYKENYQKLGNAKEAFAEDKLIVKTVATHPDWQNKQIGTMLVSASYSAAIADGLKNVVHALMYEDNVSAKEGERKFKTVPFIKYALFEKSL